MGGNEYGQCGCDPQQRDVLVPRPCVPHLSVSQVACGGMHSLVLTTTGEVGRCCAAVTLRMMGVRLPSQARC